MTFHFEVDDYISHALLLSSDNVCIDSMSVNINRKILEKCQNNIIVLERTIQKWVLLESEWLH